MGRMKHMSQGTKTALAVAGAIFLALTFYVGSFYLTRLYEILSEYRVGVRREMVSRYIETKKQDLLSIARLEAENSSVVRTIHERISADAPRVAKDIVSKHDISAFGLVDSNGAVLSRGITYDRVGDYVFQTTETGRQLSKYEETTGIRDAIATPLALVAGKRIYKDNQFVGAVLPSYFIDDSFATKLAKELGFEIAFFNTSSGVIATSFNERRVATALNAYFGLDSLIPHKNTVERHVLIGGKQYVAGVFYFGDPSPKGSGYIILLEQNIWIPTIRVAVVLSLLLLLLFLILHRFRLFAPTKSMVHGHAVILGISFAIIVIFPIALIIARLYLLNHFVDISSSAHTIYNSTLSLNPSFSTFKKGLEQRISVVVTTGGEVINAIETEINLDPTTGTIIDIDTDNSFCDKGYVIQKEIDAKKGTAHVMCIIVAEGFSGPPLPVFHLIVVPKKTGWMELSFGPDTAVLANDGLGTSVLRELTSATYAIVESVIDKTTKTATSTEASLFAFSPTHPNPMRWYNTTGVYIMWHKQASTTYAYNFDSLDEVGKHHVRKPTQNGDVVTTLNEGTHYFHLQKNDAQGKSVEEIHYPLHIDITPPTPPDIRLSSAVVRPDEVIRITFSSSDALSGLQKNFYVSYDGGVFFPTVSPFATAFNAKGLHTFTVRAFDQAGNFSDSMASVEVK